MTQKKTILAVILARGGSKRLPDKNIKWIGGKPMIAWTIEAAKSSKFITRVVVSTDSEQIAAIARQYGAEVPFKRPAKLASDTATSLDATVHIIDWLKENEGVQYDYVALLQPTSPLRTAEHLNQAIEQLFSNPVLDAMNSFYIWDKKHDWIHAVNPQNFLEKCLKIKNPHTAASQLLMPNGAIYLIKTAVLLKEKSFYPSRLGHYLMEPYDSVDVDTQKDFDFAEHLLRRKHDQKKSIFFGQREINEGKAVFIIAEAGVNHNGRLDLAIELIDTAARIGADAVKFQTFKAEQVVTEKGEMAQYQKKNLGFTKSQYHMLKSIELPEHFYPPLMERCRKKKILFLSTPHGGVESVRLLEKINMPVYKVGSGDLTNYLLLDAIARTQKPILLSVGMATLEEVRNAVQFIRSRGNQQIVVLHCTSNYPCPPDEVNMAAMKTLMKDLDLPVGYSDHTEGVEAAIMSATLGAAVYEFHFTLDKKLPGPDHIASADPQEAAERIKAVRRATVMMGSPIKQPTASEKKSMLTTVRRSLVAAQHLKKGHILCPSDLEAKRPGNGLSPVHYEELIGKALKKNLKKNEQILYRDIQ